MITTELAVRRSLTVADRRHREHRRRRRLPLATAAARPINRSPVGPYTETVTNGRSSLRGRKAYEKASEKSECPRNRRATASTNLLFLALLITRRAPISVARFPNFSLVSRATLHEIHCDHRRHSRRTKSFVHTPPVLIFTLLYPPN